MCNIICKGAFNFKKWSNLRYAIYEWRLTFHNKSKTKNCIAVLPRGFGVCLAISSLRSSSSKTSSKSGCLKSVLQQQSIYRRLSRYKQLGGLVPVS